MVAARFRSHGTHKMADPWRVLDFSEFQGSVTARRGTLVVRREQHDQEVPVEDIAVVLIGVNTQISAGTIHRLAGYGTAVIFCDWRRVPIACTYPWSTHSRVGARQRAQAELSLPRKKQAWRKIVKAKILGQAANFRHGDPAVHRQLKRLAQEVRSGDPANIEGQAARITWERLFGSSFRRTPGSGDGINAVFDYGYMILRAHVVREIVAAGLIPTLGIRHRNRSNPFALADDLIEPFRPAVDAVVQQLGVCVNLGVPEVKRALVAVVDAKMDDSNSSIATRITELARAFGMYAEGVQTQLHVPVWIGSA